MSMRLFNFLRINEKWENCPLEQSYNCCHCGCNTDKSELFYVWFQYYHDANRSIYESFKDKKFSEITLDEFNRYNGAKDNLFVEVEYAAICEKCLDALKKNARLEKIEKIVDKWK